MSTYVIRRVLMIPILLFGISVIDFVFINIAPGDPVTVMLSPTDRINLSPRDIERLLSLMRKVYNVDEVSYTTAIRGIIVISEYGKFWPYTGCGLCYVGNQIVRSAYRKFSEICRWMRADRIKISQRNDAITTAICVLQDSLAHLLSCAVRRLRSLERSILGHRNDVGLSVYRTG